MKRIIIFLIITVLSIEAFAQNFKETYGLIQNKNYFKAKSQYFENHNKYSLTERKIIEAFIFNAFNNPLKSNKVTTGFPEAAGFYRIEKSDTDPHAGVTWGMGHKLMWNAGPKGWIHIYRFDKKKR